MAKDYFANDRILFQHSEAFGVYTVTLDGCINSVWFVPRGKRVPKCVGHALNVENDTDQTIANARALIARRINQFLNPKPPPPPNTVVSIWDL